jgi:Fe-S-cluster-containing hydrogenase component 2
MSKGEGILTLEEVRGCPGWPGDEVVRMKRVAVLECVEDIPCNPCETVCPKGAIVVSEPITNLPVVDGEKCDGCGLCIAICPGLAIFMVDQTYSEAEGTVTMPYELLPVPVKGGKVKALDRRGEEVCEGEVIKVVQAKRNDRTVVVTVAVGKEYVQEVRSIRVK